MNKYQAKYLLKGKKLNDGKVMKASKIMIAMEANGKVTTFNNKQCHESYNIAQDKIIK
jgi:hypothetical protein